jgi:hypothetical protein
MPFITNRPTVRDILVHLDEPIAPPRIAPGRGLLPPLLRHARANDRLLEISAVTLTVWTWPRAEIAHGSRKLPLASRGILPNDS